MSAFTPEAIVMLVTALTVGVVIVFHYEVIQLLNRWYGRRHGKGSVSSKHRPTVLITMFVLLFAHIAEIYLFGVGYWVLLLQEEQGSISGASYAVISFLDCVYFSAANYSTVGWGDLAADGNIRFLAGTEALVGLMMITWSASYSYLVMVRAWGNDGD